MKVFVELEGCDAITEISLKCTEEQFAFLKELAKVTKVVSTYSCMPIMTLSQGNEQVDEDIHKNSKHLKFLEGVDENGNDFSYYELDTTKL